MKAHLSDGGKVNLRPSMPYDETTRQESYFLDIYISGCYAPELSVPGSLCHLTVLSGSVELTAEGENFHLLERDAIRFAADQPWTVRNMSSGNARMLLGFRYLK